jgi:hypothetical protein
MRPVVALGGALALASGAGFLTAQAIGQGNQTPTETVTINVATGATGPQGPAGPPGPPGPAGAVQCPTGFQEGLLVINHPGGQVTLFTCLKT